MNDGTYTAREWKVYVRRLPARIRRQWWYVCAMLCIVIVPLGAGVACLAPTVESWFVPHPGYSPYAMVFCFCALLLGGACIILSCMVGGALRAQHQLRLSKRGGL